MIRTTVCLLSLFFPALAMAQDVPDAAAEEEVRRYTVEVIIFRYAEDVGSGSEVFLPDEVAEMLADETPELNAEADSEADSEPGPGTLPPPGPEEVAEPLPDIELVLLDEDSLQLADTYQRLERLDAYEPVMHFGWTQATWPEEQTEAIPLHLFARPPEDLDGSLTLYLGRYLHLVADLRLRAPQNASDSIANTRDPAAFGLSLESAGELFAPPVFYRISEDRILRNGETRYYDHPRFGMLARVTRVEDEAQTEQGELLGYPVQ